MEVTIRNIPKEILVQTVSVRHNKEESENLYLFHCYRCGTGISQIKGEVMRISAGVEPSEDVPVIDQCYRCKEYYTFQTKNFLQYKRIRLTVSHTLLDRPYTTFHCVICRNQLFQYNSHFIKMLPDWKTITVPYQLDCINPDCIQKYTLMDVL